MGTHERHEFPQQYVAGPLRSVTPNGFTTLLTTVTGVI